VSLSSAPLPDATAPYSFRGLVFYFLRLGAFGFGGPIALAGYMQRDLVERRRWISEEEYVEGLALAQLAPGPLAAQLAMYLGWVRAGVLGATATGAAFILPSFLMVLALSWAYLRFGGISWMQGAFYGIGAAVIAIISRSAFKLVKMTLSRDRLLWAVFLVNALVTGWTESELVWVFVASGALVMVVRSPSRPTDGVALAMIPVDFWVTGLSGPANAATLGAILKFFALAGAVVFGSGLAIVPFLHGGVVNEFRWLTERQFLDAVAVAMITPRDRSSSRWPSSATSWRARWGRRSLRWGSSCPVTSSWCYRPRTSKNTPRIPGSRPLSRASLRPPPGPSPGQASCWDVVPSWISRRSSSQQPR
jgi:chromate transporter